MTCAHCHGKPATTGLYCSEACSAAGQTETSIGHLAFIGPWEYIWGKDGNLYRARKDSPIDTWGYRQGMRFESTPAAADLCLKVARQAFAE